MLDQTLLTINNYISASGGVAYNRHAGHVGR